MSLHSTSQPKEDAVCAVVVTFHPDAQFPQRVAAIQTQCVHVIIVDNHSPRTPVLPPSSNVEVIAQPSNIGLAAALNVGLARASELGFRWAVTFDQDSTPAPGMVTALRESRDRHRQPERVAVVGPRLSEERVQHEDHRWVVPHPSCRWLFHRVPCLERDLPGVAFVITSGALLDLRLYQKIGPMDNGLFIDYIDHDYCLRARLAGCDIVVSSEAVLKHNLGAKRELIIGGTPVRPTFHPPTRLHYMFRNRLRLLRRYALPFPHWALFDCVYTPLNLVRVLFFEGQKLQKLGAAARGTWDGLLGRSGPVS